MSRSNKKKSGKTGHLLKKGTIFHPDSVKYQPAIEVISIDTQEGADNYLSGYSHSLYMHRDKQDPDDMQYYVDMARSNIGYAAGYLDSDNRRKVFELFDTEHPILGRKELDPMTLFQAGGEFARLIGEGVEYNEAILFTRKTFNIDSEHQHAINLHKLRNEKQS